MRPIKAFWKAYPMDHRGIKTCQRGAVILPSSSTLVRLSQVVDQIWQQVQDEHPELQSCPILLTRFGYEEQEDA